MKGECNDSVSCVAAHDKGLSIPAVAKKYSIQRNLGPH